MAKPRILVSSTCEDLYVIREQLRDLIDQMGYEAVLSEEGDIYYSPDLHVHLSCIREVFNCDMVVLIVGNRFGSEFVSTDKSVTQAEHDTAYVSTIPIFAFIDQRVLHDYSTYRGLVRQADKSGNASAQLISKIPFGSRADIRVFQFIDDIKEKTTNNAYFPFQDFTDIKEILKKQWAGMLFDFLRQRREQPANQHIISLLTQLEIASTKVEQIIGLIAENTVSPEKRGDLKTIDSDTNEKRLLALLSDIWQSFPLNLSSLTRVEQLDEKELDEISSALLNPEKIDESQHEATERLQELICKLGIVDYRNRFVHFSAKFRIAEVRELNERHKFEKPILLKAIKNSLISSFKKASVSRDAKHSECALTNEDIVTLRQNIKKDKPGV